MDSLDGERMTAACRWALAQDDSVSPKSPEGNQARQETPVASDWMSRIEWTVGATEVWTRSTVTPNQTQVDFAPSRSMASRSADCPWKGVEVDCRMRTSTTVEETRSPAELALEGKTGQWDHVEH